MSTLQEKRLPSNRNYTVDDIAVILDITKSTAYRLLNSSEFSRRYALTMRFAFQEVV